jgi:signal transduction histidine kinase/ActR/RegA family two-component response regulator
MPAGKAGGGRLGRPPGPAAAGPSESEAGRKAVRQAPGLEPAGVRPVGGEPRPDPEIGEPGLRSLFENMVEGFAYCRMVLEPGQPPDFIYLRVNRAFEELTGLTDVVGRRVTEVIPGVRETNPELFEIYGRVAATGKPERFETYLPALKAWLSMSAYSSERGHFVAVSDNVTERKRLEVQLRQAQKMESVGRLAGGVAHDFNNLLTVMLSNAALAKDGLSETSTAWADIVEIEEAAKRAAVLTRQLLAFARRQVAEPRALDLNAVTLAMDKMLRRLIGEDVELVTVLAEGLGTVWADPGHVEQVLVNLAVNARDAMPDGGKLTIETSNVELDAEGAARHAGMSPGEYVLLVVSDTGHGMEPEVLEHVFEPFFTTKEKGKGTGLGLSTCYGIVKQSGGWIWASSEPGRGARFEIYLPRMRGPAEAFAPALPAELRGGSETILLVEDDPKVREVALRALRERGYRVLEAGTGWEALRAAESPGEAIALLLADVVMPHMGGRELVERVKSLRPDIRVLYTSGYAEQAIVHQGMLDPGVAFLPKPFDPTSLARKVREVLDAPVAPAAPSRR